MLFFYCMVLILKMILVIIFLLIGVAFFTLSESKIMGSIQSSRGPNVVGYLGLLQPLSDGLKLFTKETIFPSNSNKIIFCMAPLISFMLSLCGWVVLPFSSGVVISDMNLGMLYVFCISSLAVYGIIMAGWSSNNKYSFLGGLRSAAQMISYEVFMGIVFLTVMMCVGSFNLTSIVLAQEKIWFVFPLLPMSLVFFISMLVETNRHPFDLPEAEAELVSGYNVEYSSMSFALFFLGEYANMLFMSFLSVLLFFGGWFPTFSLCNESFLLSFKVLFFVVLFIICRAAFPSFSYDQLMYLGWKVFLPVTLSWFIIVINILLSFNMLPI